MDFFEESHSRCRTHFDGNRFYQIKKIVLAFSVAIIYNNIYKLVYITICVELQKGLS